MMIFRKNENVPRERQGSDISKLWDSTRKVSICHAAIKAQIQTPELMYKMLSMMMHSCHHRTGKTGVGTGLAGWIV